jgi:prepilin-type N-terminal cleavage/methylation domain-containing protein
MTLIEVMIVIAIIALVSSGVAAGAINDLIDARIKTAETECRSIRAAVQRWRALSARTDCPTVEELVREKVLESGTRTRDP